MELIDTSAKKKAIISFFLNKNILITPASLNRLKDEAMVAQVYDSISGQLVSSDGVGVFDEKAAQKSAGDFLVKVVWEYVDVWKKYCVQDFVSLFNKRFKFLEKLLQSRQELENLSSIGRISNKIRGKVSIIGVVFDKQVTKNENIMLTIEDSSGRIKVMVSKSKADIYAAAKDVVLDEVVGIYGACGDNILFADQLVVPDIPLARELKKADDDVYIVIISDIHVGSLNFLEDEFKGFIQWIRGEVGTQEQRALAKKVGYVFIVGDLVDGVGIYPLQEKDLKISDVYEQYKIVGEFIKQIPARIKIIISTGNHDTVRLAEPQPKIPKEVCGVIWDLPNVVVVGNPAVVNIHASSTFSGFDVLMYHGCSYDHYGDVVESIRNSGRNISDRNDLIMKFLLQRRHLAPTHGSTVYMPNPNYDPLVIERVPDFFLSGHVHKSASAVYRGVQIISGSCWQAKTAFQEKVGHEPEPCRVPIVNLKTRGVKIVRFDRLNGGGGDGT